MENLSDDVTTALQGRIDTLEAGYSPIEMTVDTIAKTAAAATKRTAIAAEAGQMGMDDAGIGGSVELDGMTTYSMMITRGRDGTKITITDTANPADADPANPQFAQAMDLGGGRTMHVRTMEADADGNVVEEVVIVSTDIDVPKATPFAMVEGQALTDNPKTTEGDDYRSIAVAAGEEDVNLPKIMAARFTAGTEAVLTFAANVEVTQDKDEADEVAGTYNGAMGTYRCNGATACTVDINAMGKISGIGEGWIFTPAMGATSDVPDADYLNYGFWLKRTTDEDGMDTYNEVEAFAMSSVAPSTANEVDQVGGDASYKGGAVGVYVKSVSNSDGTEASATAGHFKADASLMVYFGGNDVAVSKQDTVTGMIDNFALSGGEENSWSVALKGTRPDNTNEITGDANGGGAVGSFSGTFHGLTPATPATTDDDLVKVAPGAVVGEFNANFSNGSVLGGFGARKQ